MPVASRDAARTAPGIPRPVRTRGGTLVLRREAVLGGLAAIMLGMSAGSPHVVAAFGSTRTISFYHIHTKETLTITYKRDGKYDAEALKKINWVMRDWRQNKAIEMDPRTIDLLWEMHTELDSKEPIHIICGYRSETTNNMLRRTVGGQAKRSKHMTGQAIDATFPDVPLKRLRWSAAIREVGGIGYYPTSGVPFVHVDTGPVRAWPRLPRAELALLFPDGRTKHQPASGGALTRDDARRARANPEVATQVAAYFDLRNRQKTPTEIALAESGVSPGATAPDLRAAPQQALRSSPPVRLAAYSEEDPAAAPMALGAPAPRLVQAPRRAMPPPSDAERGRLNELVSLASLGGPAAPPAVPRPVTADLDRGKLDDLVSSASLDPGPAPPRAVPPARQETQVASLGPTALPPPAPAPAAADGAAERWEPAPEFDDDHPEELSYRPFPIAPLLTESASADDAALVKIVHPDLARTLDLLDERQIVLPMRLRPGDQVRQVTWAQQFQGRAVDFSAQHADDTTAIGLASRSVRTTSR